MNILEQKNIRSPAGKDDTCAKFTIDDTGSPYVLHDVAEENQEYTLSFWCYSETDGEITAGGLDMSTSTEWTRYVVTFISDSVDVPIYFNIAGTYHIYNAQLEIGCKATDFVLCPDDYSTVEQMEAAIELTKSSIELSVASTYATLDTATSLEARITVMADEISSKVSKDGIISSINQSAEEVVIDASKINLTGYVTIANLAADGETIINGSNIKTGIIDADLIDADALFAKDITATGTIQGANLIGARGSFTGSLFSYYGEIGGWQLESNCLYSEINPIADSTRKLTAVLQNLIPGLINFTKISGSNCTIAAEGNAIYVTPTSSGKVVLNVEIPTISAGAYRLSIDSGYKRNGDGSDSISLQYPVLVAVEDENGETAYTQDYVSFVVEATASISPTEVYRYDFEISEDEWWDGNAKVTYTMSSAVAGKTYKMAFRLLKDGLEIESTSPAYGVPADAVIALKEETDGTTELPFYLLRDGTIYTEGSIHEGGTKLEEKYALKQYLEDFIVTETITLPEMTLEGGSAGTTQTYTLSAKEGYTPLCVIMENSWNTSTFFMYIKLSGYELRYRLRNVGTAEHTLTPSVVVLWMRDI